MKTKTALILSSIAALLGGLIWAATDSNANACQNALIAAFDQNQCTTVTFWHDTGGGLFLLGIAGVSFIIYLLKRVK